MNMKKCAGAALVYVIVSGFFLCAAWFSSQAVTAMAQRAAVAGRKTIIIDPGHGGEDGGAVSCAGAMEKDINLEIALRLNDLVHLLGYRTEMTRHEDKSVHTTGSTIAQRKISDLKERVSVVNSKENQILISIHQNLYPDSRYCGAQVFYGPEGEGQILADKIQQSFLDTLNPGSHRAVKAAQGIYLMEKAQCTSVLVECGFLSNPREESLLRTPEYQQKICCAIAAAVSNFLDAQT